MDEEYGVIEYQRESVRLVVEEDKGGLIISYSNMDLEDTAFLVQFLIEKVASFTGQQYNEVLDDFREI